MRDRLPACAPGSRSLLGLAVLFFGALVLAGCGSSEPDQAAPASDTIAGGQPLVIAAQGEVVSLAKDVLGPAAQLEILPNVYEPLLRFAPVELATFQAVPGGDPGRFVGGLCEEWSLEPDGFSCRLGEQTSPFGNTVTSSDVAWTFQSLLENDGPGRALIDVMGIDRDNPITTLDEARFSINTLGSPGSFLVPALTLYVFSPFDATEAQRHATESDPFAHEWLETNTAGYGAYRVTELEADHVTLEANPNYQASDTSPAPKIGTVVYRAVPDAGERARLLEAGEVHLSRSTDFALNDLLAGSTAVTLLRFPYNAQLALLLDTTVEPFTESELRETISCAIDVPGAVDPIYRGQSVVAHTVLTPGVFGQIADETADPCRDHVTNPNPDVTRDVGPELDLHYASAIIGRDTRNYVATVVDGFEQLGIAVTPVDHADPDAFQREARAGAYPMLLTVIETHVPDPGVHLATSFGPDSPLNPTRLATSEQRAHLDTIQTTPADDPVRTEALRAYQQTVMREAAVRPFVHLLNDYALHNSICGLRSDPSDLIYWQHLTRTCPT